MNMIVNMYHNGAVGGLLLWEIVAVHICYMYAKYMHTGLNIYHFDTLI